MLYSLHSSVQWRIQRYLLEGLIEGTQRGGALGRGRASSTNFFKIFNIKNGAFCTLLCVDFKVCRVICIFKHITTERVSDHLRKTVTNHLPLCGVVLIPACDEHTVSNVHAVTF